MVEKVNEWRGEWQGMGESKCENENIRFLNPHSTLSGVVSPSLHSLFQPSRVLKINFRASQSIKRPNLTLETITTSKLKILIFDRFWDFFPSAGAGQAWSGWSDRDFDGLLRKKWCISELRRSWADHRGIKDLQNICMKHSEPFERSEKRH